MTGKLAQALADAATQMEYEERVREEMRNALIYPIAFGKSRDRFLVTGEPPIRWRNRQLVAIEKVGRQLEQRELVGVRILVDGVFHGGELIHPPHAAGRRGVLVRFRNQ